jgi:hypothetical protein
MVTLIPSREVPSSFVMITALIASDTPRQIDWHLRGAIRNAANIAEVKAVREMAIEVSDAAGIKVTFHM